MPMLLTANVDVARAFCTDYAVFYCFLLSVELQRGATLAERWLMVDDIATAAFVHHERLRNACL